MLKQLAEGGSVLLGNGRRLVHGHGTGFPSSSGLEAAGGQPLVTTIHPDFALWVLANPAGFPFLGNDLHSQCGDVFRTIVVPNPDHSSEVQILMKTAPDVPLQVRLPCALL